jgi:hypothetical protein
MSDLYSLPELVLDSRLEAGFQPNALASDCTTTHNRIVGRRTGSRQEKWLRKRVLGHGGFGIVWLERRVDERQNTPEYRAVKQIAVPRPVSEGGRYVRELEALAKFSLGKVRGCCMLDRIRSGSLVLMWTSSIATRL